MKLLFGHGYLYEKSGRSQVTGSSSEQLSIRLRSMFRDVSANMVLAGSICLLII